MVIDKARSWVGLAVFVAVCFATAWLGSQATYPRIAEWYSLLEKPEWNPPNWLFGPVWSILYLCMAIAAWLIWRKDGLVGAAGPLALFALQLALNAAWSWLFFWLRSPGLGFVDIVLLWIAIAATTVVFWRRSMVAGLLFVPYLIWVSYAAALNFAIWRLNAG